MFLFTTATPASAPPPAVATNPVVDAIRQGAQTSGTSFDYLLATAQRESALDPNAKAPTSSASGLFQFIEQTWLGLVKSDGASAGLGDYANAITTRPDGSLTVGDAGTRQAILKLRDDPKLAATFAGTLTQKNRTTLRSEIGAEPSAGDLYVAHVLGARGAADLIKTAAATPTRVAALDFPDAAAANRGIFYDRGGRPRGAAETYAALTAGQGAPSATAFAIPATGQSSPPAITTADRPGGSSNGPALYGLFQTDTRPGPISDAVARIWRSNGDQGRVKTAALSYFPRDRPGGSEASNAASAPVVPGGGSAVGAASVPAGSPTAIDSTVRIGSASIITSPPLPPARPRFPSDPAPTVAGSGSRAAPLDLLSFMKWQR